MVVRAILKETCTKGVKMSRLSSRQPTLVRYTRCPELMDRMMARVGVAPDEAAGVDGGDRERLNPAFRALRAVSRTLEFTGCGGWHLQRYSILNNHG